MKKTLTTLSLLATVIGNVAGAQYYNPPVAPIPSNPGYTLPAAPAVPQMPVPPMPGPVVNDDGVSPVFAQPGVYEDPQVLQVMQWCSSWITDISQARWQAGMEAQNGNLLGAAQHIFATLAQKVAASNQQVFNPAPHTAIAIRVGYNVLSEVFNNTRGWKNGMLKGQVRYLMADTVAQLAEKAFNDYDTVHYQDLYRTCMHGRCNGGMIGPQYAQYLPQDYYDRVRQLGVEVLDLQSQSSRFQADDMVELHVSHAIANAAKNILNSSLVRRELACAIAKLSFTEQQIGRFLNGGSSVNSVQAVQYTRALLEDARAAVAVAGCHVPNNGY